MPGTVSSLAYLMFSVRRPEAWHSLLVDVLGLGAQEPGRYRMDDAAWRILVEEGPEDDLAALGWEVPDAQSLDLLAERLRGAGVPTAWVDSARCSALSCERMLAFLDPAGVPNEVVFGRAKGEPYSSPLVASGFVAGPQGVGHVVLSGPPTPSRVAFYTDLLGLRLSDRVVTTIHGHPVDITFLHANARHHSVAIGGPPPRRVHHFLVEVGSVDDVGLAFTRAVRAGVEIVLTLGRHPNDGMFSFYARTPSGIEFEVGCGGVAVDDTVWVPTIHDRISAWGHIPPGLIPRRKEPRP